MRMICLASLVSRYVTTKYPWLDCDDYQKRNGPLKINDPHPVISYLRQSTSKYKEQTTITEFPIPWLLRMGAHLDRGNEDHLPGDTPDTSWSDISESS